MSPVIDPAQSAEEAHGLGAAIDAAAGEQDWAGVVEACQKALAHPCAQHAFYLADIWTGLAKAFALQGRYDDAIGALRSAVAAGHRAWPHPDADIARLHLLAGRRAEADGLFASLEVRTPDDPWLYEAAGLAYADIGEHREATAWFGKGIELAMACGDPEGLVAGFNEARRASLKQLGIIADDISIRAGTFAESWEAPPPGAWSPPPWPEAEAIPEPAKHACRHCGWVPPLAEGEPAANGGDEEATDNTQGGSLGTGTPGRSQDPPPDRGRVGPVGRNIAAGDPPKPRPTEQLRHDLAGTRTGVAFFPRDEWPRAVSLWPHLLDEMPADHFAYVRELQSRILQMSDATGIRLLMIPISTGGVIAYCAEDKGRNPGSGAARAEYAAQLAAEGHGSHWPPERNEACWCGSAKKYKACCGTVPSPPPPPEG